MLKSQEMRKLAPEIRSGLEQDGKKRILKNR